MKYHKQLFRHDPEAGIAGDCERTVVACLLEIEPNNVPHIFADFERATEVCWAEMDTWLTTNFKLRRIGFPFETNDLDEWFARMAKHWPGLRWLLSGQSPRGTNHVVVVEGRKIIHDPHPDGGGIIGPCDDGYYWMEFLLPTDVHGVPPIAKAAQS